MLDVETLGPPPYGRLLQIGAVGFDFNKVLEPHELLQRNLLIFDMIIDTDVGGEGTGPYLSATTTDNDTVAWWLKPEQRAAYDAINLSNGRGTPLECLTQFSGWVSRNLGKKARVWAKPPLFDIQILRHSFKAVGLECPWQHRQEACLRTLLWTAGHVSPLSKMVVPSIEAAGLIKHYALHDASIQATVAQAALRTLTTFQRLQRPPVKAGDTMSVYPGVQHVDQKEQS
jgi:hypothetical protein